MAPTFLVMLVGVWVGSPDDVQDKAGGLPAGDFIMGELCLTRSLLF